MLKNGGLKVGACSNGGIEMMIGHRENRERWRTENAAIQWRRTESEPRKATAGFIRVISNQNFSQSMEKQADTKFKKLLGKEAMELLVLQLIPRLVKELPSRKLMMCLSMYLMPFVSSEKLSFFGCFIIRIL